MKCTAYTGRNLSCRESFYSTCPGADIGNCACFMDSEKASHIFTYCLCNARENRRDSELILHHLNVIS